MGKTKAGIIEKVRKKLTNKNNKAKKTAETKRPTITMPAKKEKNQQASLMNTGDLKKKPTARIVMRREISHFTKMLEPLYAVSQGQISQENALAVFSQWEMRIKALEDADKLVEKWKIFTSVIKEAGPEELNNTALRWLNQMASFGISRDERNAVQVNEAVKHAYYEKDGNSLVIGEYMLVETPAWFLDTNVICRGILTREERK